MIRRTRPWRITASAISFIVFGAGATLITLITLLVIAPLPLTIERKHRCTRRVIQTAAWLYIRMMRELDLLTFDTIDKAALNQPGTLVMANHLTLIDALFIMSATPEATFIVKSALSRNPFTRGLIYLAGYIPNNEFGNGLKEKAIEVLRNNGIVVIFPEGTRARELGVFDFKRGAANIALETGCPIQPILISCKPIALRKHQKWYNIPRVPSHFRLRALELVTPLEHVDQSRPPGIQARALTHYLKTLYANASATDRYNDQSSTLQPNKA